VGWADEAASSAHPTLPHHPLHSPDLFAIEYFPFPRLDFAKSLAFSVHNGYSGEGTVQVCVEGNKCINLE